MTLFETETMAELCIKQGLRGEGLEIYRRLVRDAPDEVTRARRQRRLAELERALGVSPARAAEAPQTAPETAPTLVVRPRGEELELEWSLPPETRAPALQVLLVRRTAAGVETESRALDLPGARGRLTLVAPGVHSVRAAAGRLDGARFVPLARARAETPGPTSRRA